MVKNIIFDLGNVFINLDNSNSKKELQKLGLKKFSDEMVKTNHKYEKGLISTAEFIQFYSKIFSDRSKPQLINSWNSILIDFPMNRCSFIESISKKFRLFLLSNTNELHIEHFKNQVGYDFYRRFVSCFEKVYYSNEIGCRKPESKSFQIVLDENKLKASETLFIDDTLENIDSAKDLGIKTWHLDPINDDVTELFTTQNNLFDQQKLELI